MPFFFFFTKAKSRKGKQILSGGYIPVGGGEYKERM
jgi:hypothetical protein